MAEDYAWTTLGRAMAEIVNLRRLRKAKLRAEKEQAATDNRLRYGTAKVRRDLARSERERADRAIEGHKITPTDDES
jgi:hypothetical protein